MTTTISKGRSRLVILAVVAMIAALLAIPAAPAGAASAACDGAPSAGFTDLAGFTAETVSAVNCIAFYGVTQGTSATTYGPNDDVSRWQMALFLTRKLAAAGVTLPSGADQGFADIATYDAATQTAINQLAQLNITNGTSATTFDPAGIVNRWQMALFMTREVAAAGVTLPSGASQGFTDIATYDAATQTAINQLAQLGISKGTSATTYDPAGNVNRWQMALFLARDLDTLGVVPSGLTLSADKTAASTSQVVTLTVMFSKDNLPFEGQRVDVFAADKFNADGTPVLDTDATLDSGTNNATIDVGDPQTDVNGKVTVKLTHAANVAETDTIVVWTGAVGDSYDSDLVAAADQAQVTVTWTLGATWFIATVDGGATGMAPFGTSETISIQLLNGLGKAAPIAGENFQIAVYRAGGLTPLFTAVATSDATGAATFSYVGPADPNTALGDTITDAPIFVTWDTNGDGIYLAPPDQVTAVGIVWADGPAAPASNTLAVPTVTSLVSTSLSVTATVKDQYGDPAAGLNVQFTDAALGGSTFVRTTNSSGVATLTFTGPPADAADTISAIVDGDASGVYGDDPSDKASGPTTHYWVQASVDDTNILGDILAIGANYVDLDTTVGGGLPGSAVAADDDLVDYVRVYWDANDSFWEGLGVAVPQATFESNLDVGDSVEALPYDSASSGVSVLWNHTG